MLIPLLFKMNSMILNQWLGSVQLYAYTTVRNPNSFFFLFLKNSRSILLVRYNFVMQCTKSTLGKLN